MSTVSRIHFIGIGGVGMSGIALVAAARGMQVSGSDLKDSRCVSQLRDAGIEVFIGHDAANLPDDCDVVVISSAIPEKNPEYAEAKRRGYEIWHRSEMLAYLGQGKTTLACAGTHGKTTSSSMLATTIDRMGLDPSFLIGGTVDGYDTNAKAGNGDFYIVEADESDGSFVHLSPHVALITNIEPDHLDHYASIEDIHQAFAGFLDLLDDDGAAVLCAEDPQLIALGERSGKRTVSYGEAGINDPDVTFTILGRVGLGSAFDVAFPDGTSARVTTAHNPGRHNVMNATGVMAVIWALGLDVTAAAEALSTFSGVRRRFDLVAEVDGVTIVDDYGHHPTEIQATIAAAKGLDYRRICVLFQPHRYSRTEALSEQFGEAFDDADLVCVMDVYAAGEAPIPGINGKTIVDAILDHSCHQQVAWMPHRRETVPYLAQKVRPGDLLITMGAGDVTAIGPLFAEHLKEGRCA